MGKDDGGGRTERFAAFLADLASVLGDARRCAAMISYCTGLLLPSETRPAYSTVLRPCRACIT